MKRGFYLRLWLVVWMSLPASAQVPDQEPPTAPFGLGGASLFTPENPWSRAREELGRALFFDPILSSDRTTSCASCHKPDHGFSSPERLPAGAENKRAARHAPTLFNRALGRFQMWDGSQRVLEKQVLGPIENPLEMNLPLKDAIRRLKSHEVYPRLFRRSFGKTDLSSMDLGNALAVFVRTLTFGNSPIDRFQGGLGSELTVSERTGLWIYESRGHCWQCHSGPNFSDESFHNTGVGASKEGLPLPGREGVTKNKADRGGFKTPTLRGVALSAPYMHDGSLTSLQDVVHFYNEGGRPNTHLSTHIKPLGLTERELKNLVAFLKALSRN